MLHADPLQEAQLTVLSGSNASVLVRVLEVDGRKVTISSETPLRPGTPVRLTLNNNLVLAEVISPATAPNSRDVVLQVRHCVPQADLDQIARVWT